MTIYSGIAYAYKTHSIKMNGEPPAKTPDQPGPAAANPSTDDGDDDEA
jgi:hypothetical protein